MQHYTPLKLLYVAFLGLMLALFTGVLISVAYPGPKAPEDTRTVPTVKTLPETGTPATPSPEEIAQQKEYDQKWKDFQDRQKTYERNVSLIALGASVIMLVVGLVLATKIDILADGFLLGSIFTMLYSIIRGFNGESEWQRLIVTTAGLVLALVLGYVKFIKPSQK
ncbi:MAG TPA: hypothetical protein VGE59_02290 [Patescibacteria group bacterium]